LKTAGLRLFIFHPKFSGPDANSAETGLETPQKGRFTVARKGRSPDKRIFSTTKVRASCANYKKRPEKFSSFYQSHSLKYGRIVVLKVEPFIMGTDILFNYNPSTGGDQRFSLPRRAYLNIPRPSRMCMGTTGVPRPDRLIPAVDS